MEEVQAHRVVQDYIISKNMDQTLDQDAVNLAKAIRQTESGGNFQASGKSGEYGAYQFTEPTWNTYASKHGVSVKLKDATPEQQNEVAYKQIKEWKDSGLNVGQIASMWNSGKPDAYKDTTYKGINKQGVSYDVPAYAKSVATAYQSIKSGKKVGIDTNNPSSVEPQAGQPNAQGYITSANLPTPPSPTSDPNLSAGDPQLAGENNGVTSGIIGAIGGGKLAQGLGYSISNLLGTQDKNIQAQKQGEDIQKGLIQRMKENRAAGRDNTRLKKALAELTTNLDKSGKSISDIGTGGITNGQVLGSAARLGVTALGGAFAGGAFSKGTALANPGIKEILSRSIGPGEKIANLTREEAITGLTNELRTLPMSEIGTKTEKLILKALQELSPSMIEKQGLLSKGAGLGKDLLKFGAGQIIGQVGGSTAKNIYHGLIR